MSLFVDLRIAEQNTAAFCLQRADCATTTLMDYDLRHLQAKQERICNFLDSTGLPEQMESEPMVMFVGAGTSNSIEYLLTFCCDRSGQCRRGKK